MSMRKGNEHIMVKLRHEGLTFGQIAARLRVTERFVRTFFNSIYPTPPTKPHGHKAAYQRQALEMLLQQRQRQAAAIDKSITELRQEIEQMAYLEATGKALYQATKGTR